MAPDRDDDTGTPESGDEEKQERRLQFSRREMLRAGVAFPIALGAGGLLAACGGDSGGDSSTTTSSSSETTSTTGGGSSGHSDSHSDAAHTDTPHVDTSHHDTAHVDTPHADTTSNVPHSDVAGVNFHLDQPQSGHVDFSALGTHGDSYLIPHLDSHTDTAHADVAAHTDHADTGHADTGHADSGHGDVPHGDK